MATVTALVGLARNRVTLKLSAVDALVTRAVQLFTTTALELSPAHVATVSGALSGAALSVAKAL